MTDSERDEMFRRMDRKFWWVIAAIIISFGGVAVVIIETMPH